MKSKSTALFSLLLLVLGGGCAAESPSEPPTVDDDLAGRARPTDGEYTADGVWVLARSATGDTRASGGDVVAIRVNKDGVTIHRVNDSKCRTGCELSEDLSKVATEEESLARGRQSEETPRCCEDRGQSLRLGQGEQSLLFVEESADGTSHGRVSAKRVIGMPIVLRDGSTSTALGTFTRVEGRDLREAMHWAYASPDVWPF